MPAEGFVWCSKNAALHLHFSTCFVVQFLIQHRVSLPPLPSIIVPSVAVVIDKCHQNSVAEYDIIKCCHSVNQQVQTSHWNYRDVLIQHPNMVWASLAHHQGVHSYIK